MISGRKIRLVSCLQNRSDFSNGHSDYMALRTNERPLRESAETSFNRLKTRKGERFLVARESLSRPCWSRLRQKSVWLSNHLKFHELRSSVKPMEHLHVYTEMTKIDMAKQHEKPSGWKQTSPVSRCTTVLLPFPTRSAKVCNAAMGYPRGRARTLWQPDVCTSRLSSQMQTLKVGLNKRQPLDHTSSIYWCGRTETWKKVWLALLFLFRGGASKKFSNASPHDLISAECRINKAAWRRVSMTKSECLKYYRQPTCLLVHDVDIAAHEKMPGGTYCKAVHNFLREGVGCLSTCPWHERKRRYLQAYLTTFSKECYWDADTQPKRR